MDLAGSWQYICDIARSRLAHNKTIHHVSDFGEGIEVLGVAGELIARRFLGLPEKIHEGFDGGCDFMYAGKRIDVKTTLLTPSVMFRNMQWPETKPVKSDYVLMIAVDPLSQTGTIIGYATHEEVATARVNRERPYPCKEIPFTNLHPAYELVAMNLRTLQRY